MRVVLHPTNHVVGTEPARHGCSSSTESKSSSSTYQQQEVKSVSEIKDKMSVEIVNTNLKNSIPEHNTPMAKAQGSKDKDTAEKEGVRDSAVWRYLAI